MNSSSIRCKIVHLSDLHFGSNRFNKDIWDMISNRIARFEPKPHLILVTGDIIETALSRKALQNAQKCLEDLAKKCEGGELIVVPGNHDIGFKGNLRLPGSLTLFKNYLGGYYPHNISMIKELLERRGILIVPFNSSAKLRLATGEIDTKEIYNMDSYINELKDHPRFAIALRIAMLHHHPLPIPYVKPKDNDLEPFVVLRNAGTLLMELSKAHHEFDLIVHGHKHYQNFSRIRMDPRETEIGVLAAGSACLNDPESGKNSFNVITVYSNGHVNLEQINYGHGQSLKSFKKDSLFSLRGQKLRLFKRNFQRQGYKFGLVEKIIRITHSGCSIITMKFVDMELDSGREKAGRPVIFSVDKGRLLSVQLSDSSKQKGFSLNENSKDLKEYRGWVDFGQTINSAKVKVDYTLEYSTQSAYCITGEELWRTTGQEEYPIENTTFGVSSPIERLIMKVDFSGEDLFANVKPFIKVKSYEDLMEASVSTDGELMFTSLGEVKIDSEMQSYEENNFVLENDEWILEVEYPVVGYIYEICWKLPGEKKLSELGYPEIPGKVELYQKLLLEHRERRLKKQKTPPTRKISRFIGNIFRNLRHQYGSFGPETFSFTLMGYDANKNKLVMVDGKKSENGKDKDINWNFELDACIGNAGLAYKKGCPIVYNVREDKRKENFLRSKSGTLYSVLCSFPIFHPEIVGKSLTTHTQKPVIAVFTVGSSCPGTKLNQLCYNKEALKALYMHFQYLGSTMLNKFHN